MARKTDKEGRAKLSEAQLEQRRKAGQSRATQLGSEGMAQLGTLGYAALKALYGAAFAIGTLATAKKNTPTRPEQWLYNLLRKLNIQFGCQIIIDDKFIVDAGNLSEGWIIEIDGFRYKRSPFGRDGENEMAKLEAKLGYLQAKGYQTLYVCWADSEQIRTHQVEDFLKGVYENQNTVVQLPWDVWQESAF